MTITTVFARSRWNDTGIDVNIGDRVSIAASGTWHDSGIECGPEGFNRPWLRPVGWTKRCKAAHWFQLVAVTGKFDGPYQKIGKSAEFTCTRQGRLYLFANDAWAFYFNNRGSIKASIETLPPLA